MKSIFVEDIPTKAATMQPARSSSLMVPSASNHVTKGLLP